MPSDTAEPKPQADTIAELGECADLLVECPDSKAATPLHSAAKQNYLGVLRPLVMVGVLLTMGYCVANILLGGYLPQPLPFYLTGESYSPFPTAVPLTLWLMCLGSAVAWIGLLRVWKFTPLLTTRKVQLMFWLGAPVVSALCTGCTWRILGWLRILYPTGALWHGFDRRTGQPIGGTLISGWHLLGLDFSNTQSYILAALVFLVFVGLWLIVLRISYGDRQNQHI